MTALGVALHKPAEDGARAGYMELTRSILDMQDGQRKTHDDVLALRMYLDNYVKAHEVIVIPMTTTDAGAITEGPPRPSPSPGPATHVMAYGSAAPPPPMAAPPPSRPIKAFTELSY